MLRFIDDVLGRCKGCYFNMLPSARDTAPRFLEQQFRHIASLRFSPLSSPCHINSFSRLKFKKISWLLNYWKPSYLVCLSAKSLACHSLAYCSAARDNTEDTHHTPWDSLFDQLSKRGPRLEVDAENIKILSSPEAFFNQLKAGISKARFRIVLSSLYIGAELLPCELINTIHNTLEQRPSVQLTILLDYSRSTRRLPSEHSFQSFLNPPKYFYQILCRLKKAFPSRVSLYLFHTPQLYWAPKMLIHGRYRELIGVQHIKCYIFDDNLLISGANLCQQYFTNRQDRYMWICQSPNVCNFYHRLINAIGHYSFYLNSAVEYPMFSKKKPDPSFSTTEFKEQFKKEIAQLFDAVCIEKKHKNQSSRAPSDTWIFPTIQFKPAQILHDQEVCELLLTLGLQSKANSTCCIASPYFNLTDTYQRCISMSEKQINIIVASPQANGFYKKGPLLGLIPHAYQYLLKKFLEALPSKTHVEVNEYRREYWTFHSKGLWLDLFTSNKSLPSASITAIGSSNFGVRSVERDLESQLIIFTKNNNLINHLKAEKKNLLKNSKPVTSSSLNKETNLPSILIPFIASIARKYM